MKKGLFLVMFLSVLSYSAGLKSGLYITEEPQFDSLMINYNSYGDLKVFKDGKTVFLSVKIWRDTANWKTGNTGLYLLELQDRGDGTYYGKNNFVEFYVKKADSDNNKLEINIVSMDMFSKISDSRIIMSDRETFASDKNKNLVLRYSREITSDEEKEAKNRIETFRKQLESKRNIQK
ncbi:hypothetical protein [Sebaldella sp. S0638]|uniref:hypothetical protein n=1 Tax=Sebaldella sp. S0638 TaxID=2957809 RepID=UPI0020A02C94|nr:hypothetical protein [Sebaldella sp. S0638]MCP1223555.1 hypothetical protein [Sebaldella sp. S0638]